MLEKTAIGAADVSTDDLLAALEKVLAGAGYALEWVPGAVTGEYGGALLYLRWMSTPDRGAWVVLPGGSHGSRIASALVGELGRPLLYHVAKWYSGGRGGEVTCATYEMAPDGQKSPRANGMEHRDLDAMVEGGPESRLLGLIRLLVAIPDRPGSSGHQFPIYEVAEAAAGAGAPEATGEVSQSRLDEALELLRRPSSRATLRREGPDSYLVEIVGAETWDISIYLDPPTAAALASSAGREGLQSLSTRPSVRGPGGVA